MLLSSLAVLVAAAGAATNDWPGFRGGSADGVAENSSPPTTWSTNEGIAWETEIPGRGCSSPVVKDHDVFVTTVYTGKLGASILSALRDSVPVLCSVLVIIGILSIYSALQTPSVPPASYYGLSLLAVILSLQIFFAQFGHDTFNYARSCHYRWLGSCLVLMASLATFDLTRLTQSASRRLLGSCIMALGISVFAFEPGMECLFHGVKSVFVSVPLCVVLSVSGFTTILGLLMFLGKFDFRIPQSEGSSECNLSHPAVYRLLLVAVLTLLALVLLVATGIVITQSVPFFKERLGHPQLRSEAGPWASWLLLGATLTGLAYALTYGHRFRLASLFHYLRVFSVALALAIFAGTNLIASSASGLRAIICVDSETGKTKWVCEALSGPVEETNQRFSSQANPTCVADENRVIGYFGNAGVMCATRDGQLAWTNHDVHSDDAYSAVVCPVMADNVVIICTNQDQDLTIQGIDATSGKLVWVQHRPSTDEKGEYLRRAPELIQKGAGPPIVAVWGPHDFRAYDLHDGQELWSYELARRELHDSRVSGIAVDADTVLLTCPGQTYAIKRASLGENNPTFAWTSKKEGPDCSSPILYRGMAFWITEYGIAFCLDETNGHVLWQKRLEGQFFASMLAADGKVYFFNHDGTTYVVAAEREFRLLATNQLPDLTLATPAITGERIIIRGEHSLRCVQNTSPALYTSNRKP